MDGATQTQGTAADVAALLVSHFRGRDDVIAVPNGSDGFKPFHLRQGVRIQPAFLRQHLEQRQCNGFYLMTTENQVFCTCADFDNKPEHPDPDWKSKAGTVHSWLAKVGLDPLTEISQSGIAAHVWLFFGEAVDAWVPRGFWRLVGNRTDVPIPEVYPRQDRLTANGLGNLVRYPLWRQSRFADPEQDWQTIDPVSALTAARKTTADELHDIASRIGRRLEEPPHASHETDSQIADGLSARVQQLLARQGSLLCRRWYGDTQGMRDTSTSALVLSIATELVRLLVPTAEIEAALIYWCETNGYQKGDERFIGRVIDRAYEFCREKTASSPTPPPGPPPSGNGHDAAPKPIVRRLADVQAQPVRWLFAGWIPRRAITLLDGDPGQGKSTITVGWAAAVSRGWGWPPGSEAAEPASVLMLSAEDDLASTIRPRLEAAGADLTRVHALEAIRHGHDDIPPTVPGDLDHIADIVRRERVALVVIDPLMAYLSGQVDAHRDQDVRRALHQLKLVAEQTDAAIVVVRHLNKMMTVGVAMYRGGGSIGIIGAARSALIVGQHPEQPDTRVIAAAKANLAQMPRSLTYSLEPVGDVAVVGWGEPCDLTANDILARPAGRERDSAGQRAAAAIRELLADGPQPAKETEAELRRRGFGDRTIRDARTETGLVSRPSVFGGPHLWSLPPP